MKKTLLWICLLLAMCVSCAFGEDTPLYGAWSEWSETPIEQGNGIEIEKMTETVEEEIYHYHYERYIYYDKRYEAWFSTYTDEIEDGIAEDDFGYWEEKNTEEALSVLCVEETAVVYEGGWYHETEETTVVSQERTLYRCRSVKETGCVFSQHEHVINVNEYRETSLLWKGEKRSVTYETSDSSVAEVDEKGQLHGVARGECVITVLVDGVVADSCRVEVCKKGYTIKDGIYVFSLVDGTLAMGSGSDTPAQGDVPRLCAGIRNYCNRIRVENTEEDAFLLRSPYSEDLAYCWNEDGTVSLQALETVEKKGTYKKCFQWKAMQCADGSIRLYAKGSPDTVLEFSGSSLDSTACLADASVASEVQRFTLSKKVESVLNMVPSCPVPTDGSCYVTSEYGVQRTETHMHEGLDIGSFGKRVDCYSILPGTVIKINTSCKHDYGKTTMKNGRYVDPCGNTAGNYVYVDHGDGIVSVYMHLSEVDVKVGDRVTAGQKIGVTGSTGSSSGVHLHFAIMVNNKYVDPREYIELPEIGVLIQ